MATNNDWQRIFENAAFGRRSIHFSEAGNAFTIAIDDLNQDVIVHRKVTCKPPGGS